MARSTRPWSDLGYLKRVAGHRTVPVERGATYLDSNFDEQLMTRIAERGKGKIWDEDTRTWVAYDLQAPESLDGQTHTRNLL